MKSCVVDECLRRRHARGLCTTHYEQWRIRGGIRVDVQRHVIGTVQARLEAYTERGEGCWTWVGPRTTDGYGCLGINDRPVRAHRLVYTEHHGAIPDGLVVMHSCDNRLCVNPAHLSLGTIGDNIRDMWAKGRDWRSAAITEKP